MKHISTHKVIVLFTLFHMSVYALHSQSIISGKIQNRQKETVSDVSVMLMQADSTIIGYTMTDERGDYSLAYLGKESRLLLSVSAFDIKQQVKDIENRTQTVDFTIEEGSIELHEVLVKPTKMWGEKDTINYLVSSFKTDKDVVIGDVLKNMPGIDVKESGQITYRGKAINKFYIENMDMLQGRYGIATQNISADDISTVQVLENHQPIKALEDTQFSTDAAINLKIKEGKKGAFGIMAVLGFGVDTGLLWQAELTGIYFEKVRQHMSTYKNNNNGKDINKELRSFTADNPIGELQMTYVQQPSPPAIRFERYNFNNTHAATINNLFKLKNDAEVNANVIFYYNRDRRHSFAHTSYVLPEDDILTITEDISTQTTTHSLEGEFRYNLNKDRIYFNNFLTVSGEWGDSRGDLFATQQIAQFLNNRSFSANNTTNWIKRNRNGKGIEILLKNAFRMQPHHLTVTPGLYPDIFNNGEEYVSLTQHVRNNVFSSNNRFSFLSAAVFGNVKLNPVVNVNVEHQKLHSNVELKDNESILHPVTDTKMLNDIAFIRVSSGLSLDIGYDARYFKLNVFLPVNYRYTDINNQSGENNGVLHKGKIYFQPSFSARYNLTSQLEITANGGYFTHLAGLNTLYTGYILQNYRSINRYDTRLFDTNNLGGSLNIAYKNILNMFFAGGGISYNRYRRDGIYGQTLDDILTVTQLVMRPNGGNGFSVNGRVSKGFDWKSLVVSAEGSWGQNESEQLRQEYFVRYNSHWMNASASANMRPMQWLITEYKASWGRSQSSVSTGERFSAIQSLNQRVIIDISLPFDINLNGSFEHYYNSALQGNRHFPLTDMGLVYTYRGTRFSLDWTNILNTSKYTTASYGVLNSYYSEYNIRPTAIMLNVRFKLL